MVTSAQSVLQVDENVPEKSEAGQVEEIWESVEQGTANQGVDTIADSYFSVLPFPNVGDDIVDMEDLADALEAEAEYVAKGKAAFRSYEEYRRRRLSQGV